MLIFEQAENDKLDALRQAIEGGFEIGFYYRGKEFIEKRKRGERAFAGIRFVKPANLGRRIGTNEWTLRAYQTMGTTNSATTRFASGNTKGGKPHWKTFLVNEMDGIVIYDGNGETGYKAFNNFSDANVPYKQGTDAHLATIDKYFVAGSPISKPRGDDSDVFTPKGDKITNKIAKGYEKQAPDANDNKIKTTINKKTEPELKPEPEPKPELKPETEPEVTPDLAPDWVPEDDLVKESSGFLVWLSKIY